MDNCGRRVEFAGTSECGSEAVAYVPVDHAGNVITLSAGGGGPARPEMLTEDELDYGIAPDSTSTPLKPPDEEYLRVSLAGNEKRFFDDFYPVKAMLQMEADLQKS